jgi:hypothetical protein
MSADKVAREYFPSDDENMEVEATSIGIEQEFIVKSTEDILAFIQKKNPEIVPFDYGGRTCVKEGAARMAKNRLMEKHPDICQRLIGYMPQEKSEFHVQCRIIRCDILVTAGTDQTAPTFTSHFCDVIELT